MVYKVSFLIFQELYFTKFHNPVWLQKKGMPDGYLDYCLMTKKKELLWYFSIGITTMRVKLLNYLVTSDAIRVSLKIKTRETKHHSMERYHSKLPTKNMVLSTGEVTATMFWDWKSVLLVDFTRQTIRSDAHCPDAPHKTHSTVCCPAATPLFFIMFHTCLLYTSRCV